MTVTVWTERRPAPPWTQCSECSYLMGLVHGGLTAFPLGIYTDAERDAFTATEVNREASRDAGKPMFPLLVDASLARYGVRLRPVPGSAAFGRATQAELRARLQLPGNLVMLPGSYAGLPAGHKLRRWQPDFTGGHMVAVLVRPDRSLLWLDPLATRGYAGDVTDVATALAFAWTPSDAHEVMAGELAAFLPDTATGGDMTAIVRDRDRFAAPRTFRLRAGTTRGWSPGAPVPAKTLTVKQPSPARASALVDIEQLPDPQRLPHGGPFLEVLDGYFAGLYLVAADVDLDPAPPASNPDQKWLDWLATAPAP